jgi:Zn-dependent M28 family amino/carboxypeptidase
MMKKSAKTVICTLFAAILGLPMAAQGDWKRETEKAVSEVTTESLYREISFLSDTLCNGRGTGTAGASEAAFWVARKFENAGLLPMTEGYGSHFTTPTGVCGHNIIGMIPGALTMPRNRYIIVGAHYDHLGKLDGKVYPGADANASGTVVMTALADMFGAMKEMGKVYDSNIIFVAFDAKEMNMAGSASLWKLIDYSMLKDPLTGEAITKDKIKAMVNIDQIGSSLSPIRSSREDYLLMLGNESLPKDKRMNIEACNMLYDTNLDICLSYYGSKNFTELFYRLSDQRVFVDNKVPAVFFTSGITMNTNKTRDTAESLNYEVLNKRVRLIYHWIESML